MVGEDVVANQLFRADSICSLQCQAKLFVFDYVMWIFISNTISKAIGNVKFGSTKL